LEASRGGGGGGGRGRPGPEASAAWAVGDGGGRGSRGRPWRGRVGAGTAGAGTATTWSGRRGRLAAPRDRERRVEKGERRDKVEERFKIKKHNFLEFVHLL
jgi:translation initiation factor IF-2